MWSWHKRNNLTYLYSLEPIWVNKLGYERSLEFAIRSTKNNLRWVEFGVGNSTRFLLEHIPRRTYLDLFDCFEGLPEDWTEFSPLHVKGKFGKERHNDLEFLRTIKKRRIVKHAGLFSDTVPAFANNETQQMDLIHIDCDLYSSTKDVLFNMNHLIGEDTIIVFDEFYNYGGDGWLNHEYKAFMEYVKEFDRNFEYLARTNQFQVIVRMV